MGDSAEADARVALGDGIHSADYASRSARAVAAHRIAPITRRTVVITHGYWHARRLSFLMGGTYHTLEWVRMVADMVFLLAGAVPLVFAALRLSFSREAKAS